VGTAEDAAFTRINMAVFIAKVDVPCNQGAARIADIRQSWGPTPMRRTVMVRICLQLLIVLLQAALLVWVACAPLVWILRDGLGPDSHHSGWALSLFKFAVGWGVPALALAVPLYGLMLINRQLFIGKRTGRAVPS
jgi:hypothetical protein